MIQLIRVDDSSSRWIFWSVKGSFSTHAKSEGEEIRNTQQIWVSIWAKKWQKTLQSCQIQYLWLWFTGCQMATITSCRTNNPKPHAQKRQIRSSWFSSSAKMQAQKSLMFLNQPSSGPWSRMNRMKSILDYTKMGKWWMTLFMGRFSTTIVFEKLSQWKRNTIWRYYW